VAELSLKKTNPRKLPRKPIMGSHGLEFLITRKASDHCLTGNFDAFVFYSLAETKGTYW